MALPDLSKWEIWHAADALLAAGIDEPTNEQVGAQLGGDNPDVMTTAMREWRERRAGVAGAGLPDALAALVLALYQEQTTSSVALIDECRTVAARELEVVRQRADGLSAELETVTASLRASQALVAERSGVADQLRADLRREQDQAIRLQAQGVSLSTEIQRLNDELGSLRAKNAGLREQLDEARLQTSQTRTALAHEKMARRSRNRESKAQQLTLAQLKTTLQAALAESDAARTDLQSLRVERVTLLAERDVLQQRAEMAEGRAALAEEQVNAAQQRAAQLHTRIDQLRTQQDQKTDERIQTLSKLLLAGGPAKRPEEKSNE